MNVETFEEYVPSVNFNNAQLSIKKLILKVIIGTWQISFGNILKLASPVSINAIL